MWRLIWMRKFKIFCIIIIKSLLKVWPAILFSLFVTAIGYVILYFTYTEGLSAFLIGVLSSLYVSLMFCLVDSYKKQIEYKDKVLNILINIHREYVGKSFNRHILKKAFNKYYAELLSSAVDKLYYKYNFDCSRYTFNITWNRNFNTFTLKTKSAEALCSVLF